MLMRGGMVARRRLVTFLRIALLVGFVFDFGFAVISIFFPRVLHPLLDVPFRDPTMTLIAGGEFLVVALLYLALFRAPYRFRPLLMLVALDQTLATILPIVEIARAHVPATWKTLGPVPISAALAVIYFLGLRWVRNARADG